MVSTEGSGGGGVGGGGQESSAASRQDGSEASSGSGSGGSGQRGSGLFHRGGVKGGGDGSEERDDGAVCIAVPSRGEEAIGEGVRLLPPSTAAAAAAPAGRGGALIGAAARVGWHLLPWLRVTVQAHLVAFLTWVALLAATSEASVANVAQRPTAASVVGGAVAICCMHDALGALFLASPRLLLLADAILIVLSSLFNAYRT